MSDTGFWTPAEQAPPDLETLRRLAAQVPAEIDDAGAVIGEDERPRLSAWMHQPRDVWMPLAETLNDEELLALVRLFTLAEMQFSGWRGDNSSPVIAFARTLRQRGAWPAEMTAWIRGNSDNRFLPYGSLMDRLG